MDAVKCKLFLSSSSENSQGEEDEIVRTVKGKGKRRKTAMYAGDWFRTPALSVVTPRFLPLSHWTRIRARQSRLLAKRKGDPR